ncbi:UDP-galactopyranose mutase [Parabacteroides sp. OttesenSCG-928-G07]|nr:UDP-galactopyranose mutase [Parabacteroides sp. OttesenSCG-928-G21]MDL2278829.1 UDP-galactopyranose mutase [Parabacteroides sp. OttesenSCG-928-G07]
MYDYLIVGAGLFGSVFAQTVSENGKRCLVIDKRSHIGGNVYSKDVDGIQVHLYGAHIFHTDKENIWQYVNRFTSFNHYINSPLACYKGKLYNLPFNMNTFNKLWNVNTPEETRHKLEEQRRKYHSINEPANLEEQALKLCGDDIYYTFIKEYTEKQWGRSAKELPPFIIKRIPFRFTYDNNYFSDPYQGIPKNGYTAFIHKLLKGIEVKTNTNYFDDRAYFDQIARKVIFTGCIDEYFDYNLGRLEYRSLRFEHERLETDNYQGNAVINYNEASVPYTRMIEHKHFNFGNQPFTIVTKEYPQTYTSSEEPYYPINDEKNSTLLKEYKEQAKLYPDTHFGGRLGQYAYFDMDDTVEAALLLAKEILSEDQ